MTQKDEGSVPNNVVPLVNPNKDELLSTFSVTVTEPEDDDPSGDSITLTDDDNELLASLLGGIDLSKLQPQMSAEDIQKQADRREAESTYDVAGNNERVLNEVAALRAQISSMLESLEAHLCAEWNKAVVNDDNSHIEFLTKSEAPRWMQMARSDFQIALMKLDRSIGKQQGL